MTPLRPLALAALVTFALLAGCAGKPEPSTLSLGESSSTSSTAPAASGGSSASASSSSSSSSPTAPPSSSPPTTQPPSSTTPTAPPVVPNNTVLAPPGPQQWFLHDDGCDSKALGATMNFTHADGEPDGCGSALLGLLGPAGAPVTGADLPEVGPLGAADGSMRHYTTVEHSRPLASGATFNGTVFLEVYAPTQLTVQVDLLADGETVATASVVKVVTGAYVHSVQGTPLPVDSYVGFNFTAATTAAITDASVLEVALFVTGAPLVFVGYDADHVSRFTL
jgi:hypothetical protein